MSYPKFVTDFADMIKWIDQLRASNAVLMKEKKQLEVQLSVLREVKGMCKVETIEHKEIMNCKYGVYKVFWRSGGHSVASIGGLYDGQRWLAPSNWTAPNGHNPTCLLMDKINDIDYMIRME